jgi:hypothetical protein
MPAGQSAAPAPEGADKLSPEAQQAFDLVVNQATDFILQDENIDALVESAKTKGPAQAIADDATEVLRGVHAAATGAGKNLPPEILSLAGSQVATIFASVLANEGVIDPKSVSQIAEQAYDVGVKSHNSKGQPQGAMPQPQGAAPAPGMPQPQGAAPAQLPQGM